MELKVGMKFRLKEDVETLRANLFKGEIGELVEIRDKDKNVTYRFEFEHERYFAICNQTPSKYFDEVDTDNQTVKELIQGLKELQDEINKKTNPIVESQTYDNINPNHYKQSGKDVIEMMVDIWGKENVAKYCEMNAFKYRMRVGLKPNQPIQQEIDKAIWYENKSKELNENND